MKHSLLVLVSLCQCITLTFSILEESRVTGRQDPNSISQHPRLFPHRKGPLFPEREVGEAGRSNRRFSREEDDDDDDAVKPITSSRDRTSSEKKVVAAKTPSRNWELKKTERPPKEGPKDVAKSNKDAIESIDEGISSHEEYHEEVPESSEHYFVLAHFPKHKFLIAKFVVAPLILTILLTFVLNNYLEHHHAYLSWLPESMLVITMGIIFGLLLQSHLPSPIDILEHGQYFASFSSTLLNLVLLPIIIFESGWNMRRKDFGSQFSYILMFAFLGTAITATMIGLMIKYTGLAGWHPITGARTCFAYGALLSATDPIAALSTYAALKVDPLLNTMVFGESALNDSVAIVIFNILNNDAVAANMTSPSATVFTILYNMVYLFFGSIFIGVGTGMLYCLTFKYSGLDQQYKVETLFIVVSCYLTAACAEMAMCSGIIAVFFEGVIVGIYARPHLSKAGCLLANFFVKQIVNLADNVVFLLTGVAVVRLTFKGFRFGALVFLFCIISRLASVFPVGAVVNAAKARVGKIQNLPREDWHLLEMGHLVMMSHAGLRGAIALVLCMELGDWVDKTHGEGTKQMLQNCTFFLIIVLQIVLGGSTEALIGCVNVPYGEDVPLDKLWKTEGPMHMAHLCRTIDERFFSPLLLTDPSDNLEERAEEDIEELLKNEMHGGRGMRKSANPNWGKVIDGVLEQHRGYKSAPALGRSSTTGSLA